LRWYIGGVLFLSTVINYMDRQTLSVLAPDIKREFGWNNQTFALLIIAFRVAYALGQRYGAWVWRVARMVPGFGAALERLRTHAETSARLAAEAGCSARTEELIRNQDAPTDPDFGELLRVADEAN